MIRRMRESFEQGFDMFDKACKKVYGAEWDKKSDKEKRDIIMSFIATAAKKGLDAEKGKEKKESKVVPMPNRRFRRSLKEGRGWNYDMPQELCGILREAIKEEDYITVLETLKNCYDWILENVEDYTEYEYEDDISDIDIQIENINDGYSLDEDEPYDAKSEVDYLLQNFYDVCDGYRIWVTP